MTGVMPCLLLTCGAALVGCDPPSKEVTMRNPNPAPATDAREARETAAQSAREAPPQIAAPRADSPAEAEGRRTLSTAFVRVGPDGRLTVELRDGRALVLRDVVMRPRDFCGIEVLGGSAGKRYCGGYGEVAAARAGGGPAPNAIEPATLDPAQSPAKRE